MKILLTITLIFLYVFSYSQDIIYDTISKDYNGWTNVYVGNSTYTFYEKMGDLSNAEYDKYVFENDNISIEFHTDIPINVILFKSEKNDTIKTYLAVRKGENLGYDISKGEYLFMYTFKEKDLINIYDISNDKNLIISFSTESFNVSYLKDYQISNDILIEFLSENVDKKRIYYVTKTINQVPTDTDDIKIDIKIYPNPVQNELYIKSEEKIDRIDIINETGGLIKTIPSYDGSYINMSSMQRGMYIINIIINNQIHSYKIIKN